MDNRAVQSPKEHGSAGRAPAESAFTPGEPSVRKLISLFLDNSFRGKVNDRSRRLIDG
jgi:hypothetical protein